MKTDLEKFKELMTSFGVDYETHQGDGKTAITFERLGTVEADKARKIVGYASSYAEFAFNADGKFELVGVWE